MKEKVTKNVQIEQSAFEQCKLILRTTKVKVTTFSYIKEKHAFTEWNTKYRINFGSAYYKITLKSMSLF